MTSLPSWVRMRTCSSSTRGSKKGAALFQIIELGGEMGKLREHLVKMVVIDTIVNLLFVSSMMMGNEHLSYGGDV